jgi:hypothetical protein
MHIIHVLYAIFNELLCIFWNIYAEMNSDKDFSQTFSDYPMDTDDSRSAKPHKTALETSKIRTPPT